MIMTVAEFRRFVETEEKYAKFLTGVNVNKKVIRLIARDSIRED